MNINLFQKMMLLDEPTVDETYSVYKAKQRNNAEKGMAALVEQGFEETDYSGRLLPDGRDVFEQFGKRWVLNPELHAERQAQAFEAARARDAAIAAANPETAETKSVAGTDGLAEMTCPRCGDSLQYSTVCGACSAGKAGYRHRYSCVHGHVDFVSKEKI